MPNSKKPTEATAITMRAIFEAREPCMALLWHIEAEGLERGTSSKPVLSCRTRDRYTLRVTRLRRAAKIPTTPSSDARLARGSNAEAPLPAAASVALVLVLEGDGDGEAAGKV